MILDHYLEAIRNKQIPLEPPDCASFNGFMYFDRQDQFEPEEYIKPYKARQECNELGMWPIVDQVWTKALAEWIGPRKVLEVMAGGGWIAKALSEHGVKVIATDDFSWNDRHTKMELVYPVEKFHALEAIVKIPADILLISWPPYEDETISAACRLWDGRKPIIYIGESDEGCNAPESFWKHFRQLGNSPDIPLMSWSGIHDYVFIGHWVSRKRKKAAALTRVEGV